MKIIKSAKKFANVIIDYNLRFNKLIINCMF